MFAPDMMMEMPISVPIVSMIVSQHPGRNAKVDHVHAGYDDGDADQRSDSFNDRKVKTEKDVM